LTVRFSNFINWSGIGIHKNFRIAIAGDATLIRIAIALTELGQFDKALRIAKSVNFESNKKVALSGIASKAVALNLTEAQQIELIGKIMQTFKP
jgi:hypothetical protein